LLFFNLRTENIDDFCIISVLFLYYFTTISTLSPNWHSLRKDNSPFHAIFPINICTQFVWSPPCLLNRVNGLQPQVEFKAAVNPNSNLVYVWPTFRRWPVGWHFSRNGISPCEGSNSITQCLPSIRLLKRFTPCKIHTAVCTLQVYRGEERETNLDK